MCARFLTSGFITSNSFSCSYERYHPRAIKILWVSCNKNLFNQFIEFKYIYENLKQIYVRTFRFKKLYVLFGITGKKNYFSI